MDNADEDDDIKLAKASIGLLNSLEQDIPKLLYKSALTGTRSKRVHTRVKRRHLDHVVNLIEPFQGDPQLLDAKLKTILPPIVDAYLEYLVSGERKPVDKHVNLQFAVCNLLYTLCKVRGYKIIVAFLNNEPRFLEHVLEALEQYDSGEDTSLATWQVPYVLLLWLGHLLLAPFDLSSISAKSPQLPGSAPEQDLPPLVHRLLHIGRKYLHSSTKAQDAASAMLVRLAIRPDVLPLRLADRWTAEHLPKLTQSASNTQNMYATLGSLRLMVGVASASELSHLVPDIYRPCAAAFDEHDSSALSSNAVAKKLIVKIFRNIATLALRSVATSGPLLHFLQTTDVLEDVIDYLLRSLSDKDTPVRFAAAKATSLIVLELDPEMAHDVIQAVLDSFKEDMPRDDGSLDFSTTNALRWHGLTLTLSHMLFKRSASVQQLPDILIALIAALQYQQRTATGSTLGTNVRDAANFGIWSLARRYITAELLLVPMEAFHTKQETIIQHLAVQLILSACFDPAGNIRRGSSAALQELVGRHPDQVHQGISLVQIVDYLAVSLRSRAMVDIANKAARLHSAFWPAVLAGTLGWRGLGSADLPSREAAASSIAGLITSAQDQITILQLVGGHLLMCSPRDTELLHGMFLAAANVIEQALAGDQDRYRSLLAFLPSLIQHVDILQEAIQDFSSRTLRSDLSASMARYITALYKSMMHSESPAVDGERLKGLDSIVDKLLTRHEESIIATIPELVRAMLALKRARSLPLGNIGVQTLSKRVSIDGAMSTMHSAGRAIALGALAPCYESSGMNNEKALAAAQVLADLLHAMNVEWRVIGVKAIQLIVETASGADAMAADVADVICKAVTHGLNDYTIDERGDVGSLVRLQCISCTSKIFSSKAFNDHPPLLATLKAEIYRLSLEKLDRVRLSAAHCRYQHFNLLTNPSDVASVSSRSYFEAAILPTSPSHPHQAVLEGLISCAGVGAENVLQASREVLAVYLSSLTNTDLEVQLSLFTTIMKRTLDDPTKPHPALELLAFLLDMQIPQRLADSVTFKWRNVLSLVQKSHHKSNDIPKILAAVHVYAGLADVPAIRGEVLKKLISMLKTNPYPRVRVAVAETLWMVTRDQGMMGVDWARPARDNAGVVEGLGKYVTV
ncbi:Tubulin-specific chaperone D [Fulvia fulva]|nr:Tubulin-specific chaperone D [Fulvia fulva]WPV18189.1 Tubulin-specific chaperone D [Fulvia fulva]WPV32934.1 Tubulin-specific chaperone D [Fulvia fulva]